MNQSILATLVAPMILVTFTLAACGESAPAESEAPTAEAPTGEAPAAEAPADEAPAEPEPTAEEIAVEDDFAEEAETSITNENYLEALAALEGELEGEEDPGEEAEAAEAAE